MDSRAGLDACRIDGMRYRNTSWAAIALLIAATLVTGCATEAPEATPATEAPAAEEQPAELPAGHPPLSSAPSADSLIAPPPPGSGTGETGLSWTVPPDWISEPPSSAMRRAQYRVPGPAGDGELVIFYFGPGQGGASQFAQPDGRTPQEAMKTEEIQVGDVPVLLTEVTGTYSGGMTMMGGQSANLENHMLLGAIAQGGDANWFFKLTGPEATLTAQREAFRGMIESLRRGG